MGNPYYMKNMIISMLLFLSKLTFFNSKIKSFIEKQLNKSVKNVIEEKINQKFDVDVHYSLNDFQLANYENEKEVEMKCSFSFSDDDIKRIIYHYLKIDIVAQIKKFEFTRTENNSFEVELFASAADEEIKKLISNKF